MLRDTAQTYVVNHREADWHKKVKDITKKQGVDVIFEHIGKATFAQEVALLRWLELL